MPPSCSTYPNPKSTTLKPYPDHSPSCSPLPILSTAPCRNCCAGVQCIANLPNGNNIMIRTYEQRVSLVVYIIAVQSLLGKVSLKKAAPGCVGC